MKVERRKRRGRLETWKPKAEQCKQGGIKTELGKPGGGSEGEAAQAGREGEEQGKPGGGESEGEAAQTGSEGEAAQAGRGR
eukprot:231556-Chlamydomonas_euryale.AAC.1